MGPLTEGYNRPAHFLINSRFASRGRASVLNAGMSILLAVHYVALLRRHHFSPNKGPQILSPPCSALRNLKFNPLHRYGLLVLAEFFGCRYMAHSSRNVEVKDQIELAEWEKRIFDRLLGTLVHFNLQAQLRVAGGWVRDKLLGKDCYDIDIAIDNMLGREFCEKVSEYLSSIGEETRGAGIVPRNPEQSKHLETATMRICDVWIDFVNLRSEDYSEDSRIPMMKFGTTEQDAYRRDLTINSLFYNINTGAVEDVTGRGLEDLRFGRIVTPLPPKETFLDDPLRVLRAIRFGARFEFALVEELKDAAASEDVKVALSNKISRERIGHEIELMISGNQPVQAITSIWDLNLSDVVFCFPLNIDPPKSEIHDRCCIAYLDATWSLVLRVERSTFSDEQRKLCLYAALFLPYRKTTFSDKKSGKVKKIPVVDCIFRNSLKLKARYSETVINIHNATEKFVSLIPLVLSKYTTNTAEVKWRKKPLEVLDTPGLRVVAGLLLREIKEFWRVALLLSVLLYCEGLEDMDFPLEKKEDIFSAVQSALVELGLDKVWELKPIMNGREIIGVLQLKTGGPLVKEWQQKLLEWQLAHPSATYHECLCWMREAISKRPKLD